MTPTSEIPVVVLPERQFTFPGPDTGSQQITIAERIDLLQWRELTLRVRVHSHTLTGTNVIAVSVLPESRTEEDPGLMFVGSMAAATTTIGASLVAPAFVAVPILTLGANAVAALGRLQILATRTGAGTMKATLSIDICAKES
jgi:hypothetical protein